MLTLWFMAPSGHARCRNNCFVATSFVRWSSFLCPMPTPTRILFVDDDPDLRHLWRSILSSEGLHRVIADHMQSNLLAVDISMILPDFIDVGNKLHLMSKYALQAFLHPEEVKA